MLSGLEFSIIVGDSNDNVLLMIVPSATVIHDGIDSILSSPIESGSIEKSCIRVSFKQSRDPGLELPEFIL